MLNSDYTSNNTTTTSFSDYYLENEKTKDKEGKLNSIKKSFKIMAEKILSPSSSSSSPSSSSSTPTFTVSQSAPSSAAQSRSSSPLSGVSTVYNSSSNASTAPSSPSSSTSPKFSYINRRSSASVFGTVAGATTTTTTKLTKLNSMEQFEDPEQGCEEEQQQVIERPKAFRKKSFSSPDSLHLAARDTQDEPMVLAEGILLYEHTVGNWEKRYCVLTPEVLIVSKAHKKTTDSKKIKLIPCSEMVSASDDKIAFLVHEFCFRILFKNQKELFFRAENRVELQMWLEAFKTVIMS